MKTAEITFDENYLENLDMDSEAWDFAWKLKNGLLGRDYAPGRGILSIKVESDELITLPNTRDKLGMD